MNKIKFSVQGSAKEPYEVEFQKINDNLTASCTCPAGANGLYCKHRVNIIQGVVEGIVSANRSDVALVKTWLAGTDAEAAIKEVAFKECELERVKHELAIAKKILSRVMRDSK